MGYEWPAPSGLVMMRRGNQGVALDWHWSAPLALKRAAPYGEMSGELARRREEWVLEQCTSRAPDALSFLIVRVPALIG